MVDSKKSSSNKVYEADIKAYTLDDLKDYKDNTLIGYQKEVDFLFDFLRSLKNETIATEESGRSLSEQVFTSLMGRFSSRFEEKGDLKEVILQYISDLNQYNFEVSVEQVKELVYYLRSEKIKYFERILEEYLKDRERYNNLFTKYQEASRNGSLVEVRGKDAYIKKLE